MFRKCQYLEWGEVQENRYLNFLVLLESMMYKEPEIPFLTIERKSHIFPLEMGILLPSFSDAKTEI